VKGSQRKFVKGSRASWSWPPREVRRRCRLSEPSSMRSLGSSGVIRMDWDKQARAAVVNLITQGNTLAQAILPREAEARYQETAGGSPSPLEALLAEQIVVCWLQVILYQKLDAGSSNRKEEALRKRGTPRRSASDCRIAELAQPHPALRPHDRTGTGAFSKDRGCVPVLSNGDTRLSPRAAGLDQFSPIGDADRELGQEPVTTGGAACPSSERAQHGQNGGWQLVGP
jgi:hypothetical protein